MPTLILNDVPQKVVDDLNRRAEAGSQSLRDVTVAILSGALQKTDAELPLPNVSSAASRAHSEIPRRRDSLVEAQYKAPTTIFLRFDDGRWFDLSISAIPIDAKRINWQSATASGTGESMLVLGVKGDEVPIDAGTLRCLVDREYAEEIKVELHKSRPTRAQRLEQLKNTSAAPDWLFEPSPDMRRDSWK